MTRASVSVLTTTTTSYLLLQGDRGAAWSWHSKQTRCPAAPPCPHSTPPPLRHTPAPPTRRRAIVSLQAYIRFATPSCTLATSLLCSRPSRSTPTRSAACPETLAIGAPRSSARQITFSQTSSKRNALGARRAMGFARPRGLAWHSTETVTEAERGTLGTALTDSCSAPATSPTASTTPSPTALPSQRAMRSALAWGALWEPSFNAPERVSSRRMAT